MKLIKTEGKWTIKKPEKKEEKHTVNDCICELVAYVGSLHIAHWMADTITNEHKAIGDLYDALDGSLDSFVEVYIGKYGMIKFQSCELPEIGKKPCAVGLNHVKRLQTYFVTGQDDDLINIIADMMAELNKAKYLLKE